MKALTKNSLIEIYIENEECLVNVFETLCPVGHTVAEYKYAMDRHTRKMVNIGYSYGDCNCEEWAEWRKESSAKENETPLQLAEDCYIKRGFQSPLDIPCPPDRGDTELWQEELQTLFPPLYGKQYARAKVGYQPQFIY